MSYDPFDDNSSENNPDFQPHEWHDGQSTKSGMSSTMKVTLIITGIVGISFLLCCGTIGYFMYQFIPKPTSDPVEINKLKDEIISIELHPDLEPKSGVDMGMNSLMKMKMVVYYAPDLSAFLSIGQIELKGGNVNKNITVNQDMHENDLQLDDKETEIKKIMIDGNEIEFTIVRGTDHSSGDKAFTIKGLIEKNAGGKNKAISIDVSSKSKTFDEEAAIKMIETIKIK